MPSSLSDPSKPLDDRLAALVELARPRSPAEEPAARLAFSKAWTERWLAGAGPEVDRAAWAKAALGALTARRLAWLGRSHHKPTGAASRMPPAEAVALRRAALCYLIGLLQGDPAAFLEAARNLGGLSGLHAVAGGVPGLSPERLSQTFCKAALSLPEQESNLALEALLNLSAGCAEFGPRLSLWLAAGKAALAPIEPGAPTTPDLERFNRVGLPALALLCSRSEEIDSPRWATLMANAASHAGKATPEGRAQLMDLAFRAIERQGGSKWLLSGFGHQELLSWVSDTDEAAELAARCFASQPGNDHFWGVYGGFRSVMERQGGKSCERLYRAGANRFGPPMGPDRNAPLGMLWREGHWELAAELSGSTPELSARQAKAALAAAREGAKEIAQMEALYGRPVSSRLPRGPWAQALLSLAAIAEPEQDPSLALKGVIDSHPLFGAGIEAAALGGSIAEPAVAARRLSL